MRIYLLVEDLLDSHGRVLYAYLNKKQAESQRDFMHRNKHRDDVLSYRVETHTICDGDENDSQQQQENYS